MYGDDVMYYSLLHLLLVDISSNPVPSLNQEESHGFKNAWLHFLLMSIDVLLLKIADLRYLAKLTKATAIGIIEARSFCT